MSRQDESDEILTKVESVVRIALQEIQQGGILCVPKSMAQRQLEGAVRIVMRHLAQECPQLAMLSSQDESVSKAKQGHQE